MFLMLLLLPLVCALAEAVDAAAVDAAVTATGRGLVDLLPLLLLVLMFAVVLAGLPPPDAIFDAEMTGTGFEYICSSTC